MTKRTENLDEQIQALEDEIADLQRRWMPYKMVQPMLPGQQTGMGAYNPTRFLEKSKISIAIDRKQIELADLQRQRAEQTLAAFEDAGGLTDAESAYQDAQTTYEEAKQAIAAAEGAFHQTRQTLLLQRERHTHLTKAIERCQASERRWSDELAKDRGMAEYVGTRTPGWGGVAMTGVRPIIPTGTEPRNRRADQGGGTA